MPGLPSDDTMQQIRASQTGTKTFTAEGGKMTGDLTGNVIEPELGRQVLAEIGDLNAGFIELMLQQNRVGAGAATVLALPVAQAERIAALRPVARQRLTHCAFALFDLRLEDAGFWDEVDGSGAPDQYRAHDCGDPAVQRGVELFTLAALMHLRHLATVNRFLAGLSFGANDEVLEAMLRLSLMQLQAVAAAHPGLLCCRLGTRPDAWRILVQLARRTDGHPMLPARILGFQHTDPR